MTALTEFLYPAPAPRRATKIIGWWERRRLAYNVAVGAAGLVSLGVVSTIASLLNGQLTTPPWQPVVVFGVLANVCYLLGPCGEILVMKLWGREVFPVGPALYRIGLTFSVGLALFPTLLALLVFVVWVAISLLG
jgi:hypothetical protein